MRKVKPIRVELAHEETPGGKERLQRAYDRLIALALDSLRKKQARKSKGRNMP